MKERFWRGVWRKKKVLHNCSGKTQIFRPISDLHFTRPVYFDCIINFVRKFLSWISKINYFCLSNLLEENETTGLTCRESKVSKINVEEETSVLQHIRYATTNLRILQFCILLVQFAVDPFIKVFFLINGKTNSFGQQHQHDPRRGKGLWREFRRINGNLATF